MFLIVVSVALIAVTALWKFQESPHHIGSSDPTDTMKPYATMEILSPTESEIVKQIIGDDTLYFRKQKVDTGYVLKPLHRVRRLWTPEDSADTGWEEWFDTSRGWCDGIDSTDTMPAVDSIPRDTTYVDTFYKRDGVWRSDDTDED